MSNNKCHQCREDAVMHITWGLFDRDGLPYSEADFCKSHSDELWKRIHGSVNALVTYAAFKEPNGVLIDPWD